MDIVLANDREQEMYEMAISLGSRELVFMHAFKDAPPRSITKNPFCVVKRACYIDHIKDYSAARKKFDYLIAPAQRAFFEREVDYIIDAEMNDMNDSVHYRKTQLNHVTAQLAQKNTITIIFNFNNILRATYRQKQIVIGRMLQNARICSKYRVKTAVCSIAREPLEMRSESIRDALRTVLALRK